MLAVALTLALLQQTPSREPSLAKGRAYVKALMAGEAGVVWKAASPQLVQRFGGAAAVTRFSAQVRGFGAETRLISEGLSAKDGLTVYRRVMAVANYARGMQVDVAMDGLGRVASLALEGANQAAPTTTGAYRSLAQLRLPVEGSWFVLWGGRTFDDNKHAAVSDMRYALDLLMAPRGGGSFARRGTRNEDYFAWRQPVVAPGGGTVVVAVDGVPDNTPNRPVPGNLYGNYVVIDHGTGEYSLLAHLNQGSVKVKVGEPVSAGQPIGRTGNSGMSTEPHLHYHLMDHADWHKAQGLPAQFSGFLRNGQQVERGEPRRGDTIATNPMEARR
jgi:Peptidase family M23